MSIYVNANIDSKLNESKRYFGNYLGIVIQNNDPDKGGKIKIWVPHISPTVYKNWDEKNEDKSFKFIGKNIDSDITDIIEELKVVVPWAECASPLVGSMAPARYNAYSQTATISDSNKIENPMQDAAGEEPIAAAGDLRTQNIHMDPAGETGYKLNSDGIGEKPARKYERHDLKVADAFSNKNEVRFNNVNKFSYNYVPTSYSNSAKGSFSVPNVGAHVWVFFAEGNPDNPVYFATTYGEAEWKSIYNSDLDYPGSYENVSTEYNHNTDIYRNKYVINQKGGTIEIVSTDNKEALKLTHYSGSFKEFNNDVNIEFASKNNQKLVQGDEFFTINGTKNDYIGRDYDQIINGDYYKKIGNLTREYQKEWRDLMESVADGKQLFELKRAEAIIDPNDFIKKTSGLQRKLGTPGPCPLCSEVSLKDQIWDNAYTFKSVIQNAAYTSDTPSFEFLFGVQSTYANTVSDLIDPGGPARFLGKSPCPVCGGSGKSPSSRDGDWDVETDKEKHVIDNLQTKIQKIIDTEKKLGLGGSEIVNITKHKIENIGLIYNDFPSVRIDEVGKIENYQVQSFDKGVVTTKKESALLEYVHQDDFPGGDYTQNIGNKWNVLVGSGGVSIKSTGGVDIGGTITNIAGQQVNISSEYEINMSSKRIDIAADMLTLRNKHSKQVLVDSNLGVSQNVVIQGGAHVEGELSVHHVSAPVEVQETEPIVLFGKLLEGLSFDVNIDGGRVRGHPKDGRGLHVTGCNLTLVAPSNDNLVESYPHTHPFKNLPLKLYVDKDGVRATGTELNSHIRSQALPVVHEKKGGEPTVSPAP
jgi:hypothetical protein